MAYPDTPGFRASSATSQAAAESTTSKARFSSAILAWLKDRAGAGGTCFEAVEMLRVAFNDHGIQMNWVSGRLTELSDAGHISATPMKRVNPQSGKSGTVWVHGKWVDHLVPDAKLVTLAHAGNVLGELQEARRRLNVERDRLAIVGHGVAVARGDGFRCKVPVFCKQCRQEQQYVAMMARRVTDLEKLETK